MIQLAQTSRRHTNATDAVLIMSNKICQYSECLRVESRSSGLCEKHYKKQFTTSESIARVNMVARCYNKNHPSYSRYGGRGITVCDDWRYGRNGKTPYQTFLEDMGPKPSPELSIERIDNDGNYNIGNCKWATRFEQQANRRTPVVNTTGYKNVYIERNGKYRAVIKRKHQIYHLGIFADIEDASKALATFKQESVQ